MSETDGQPGFPGIHTYPVIMKKVPYFCIRETPFRIRYLPDVSMTDTLQKGMFRHKTDLGHLFDWPSCRDLVT
jgi:hypothetical protein